MVSTYIFAASFWQVDTIWKTEMNYSLIDHARCWWSICIEQITKTYNWNMSSLIFIYKLNELFAFYDISFKT